jgi:hypothetical protein
VNRKCDRSNNDEKMGTAYWLVASTRRIGLSLLLFFWNYSDENGDWELGGCCCLGSCGF